MIYSTSVGELRFTIQECTLVVHRTIRGGIVMGKFHLIYYVNLGAPDIAYSLEKALQGNVADSGEDGICLCEIWRLCVFPGSFDFFSEPPS